MTLQQMLDMVMLKYPHAYTNEQVIGIINDVQVRLFRTLYRVESMVFYDLQAGLPVYEIDYSPDTIITVTVNGRSYDFHSAETSGGGRYWYTTDAKYLGIYPTPEESVSNGLVVTKYMTPDELTAEDLEAVPDFDRDWHKIIVVHVCRELATIDQMTDMVNNFTTDVNDLENEYKRSKRMRAHKIQDVYGGVGL